jgi:hypothetical protein
LVLGFRFKFSIVIDTYVAVGLVLSDANLYFQPLNALAPKKVLVRINPKP